MSSFLKIFIALIFIVPFYLLACHVAWDERAQIRQATKAGYVIPSKFSRILAVDYQGLLSDYQFLKLITFYGERVQYGQKISEDDWIYITESLETITDLDPYFMDAYLFGESLLAWEADRVKDANHFLMKGMKHINNWKLPFYIGCNYFLFLGDFEKGAEYLKVASKLPESPSFLPTLAARLDYYAGNSNTAILFLKGLLAETREPQLRQKMEKRMLALQRAADIENALEMFEDKYGRPPEYLKQLVLDGILDELPVDPYGGQWVVLKNGRVFSTSKFAVNGRRGDE